MEISQITKIKAPRAAGSKINSLCNNFKKIQYFEKWPKLPRYLNRSILAKMVKIGLFLKKYCCRFEHKTKYSLKVKYQNISEKTEQNFAKTQ